LDDTELEFPPNVEFPHVMTLPLLLSAANAALVEETVMTPAVKLEDTELELPPSVEFPHVIILPVATPLNV
jgi:hypothetical protein